MTYIFLGIIFSPSFSPLYAFMLLPSQGTNSPIPQHIYLSIFLLRCDIYTHNLACRMERYIFFSLCSERGIWG